MEADSTWKCFVAGGLVREIQVPPESWTQGQPFLNRTTSHG